MLSDKLARSIEIAAVSDRSQVAIAREAIIDQPISTSLSGRQTSVSETTNRRDDSIDPHALEMSVGLDTLPDVLLLNIIRIVPDVLPVALTNKRFLQISADVLVQQAATIESFSKATAAIEWLSGWANTGRLVDELYKHGCVQAIEYIICRNFEAATIVLDIIHQLPDTVRVTDNDMLQVVKTCRDLAIEAIDNRSLNDAERILKVICHLPPSTYLFDIVRNSRNCLIEDINGHKLDDAVVLLRLVQLLPSSTHVPHNYFLKVVKTCRKCIIKNINDGNLEDAEQILNLVQGLPYKTYIPDNYFSGVLKTCRGCLIDYIKDGDFEEAKEILVFLWHFRFRMHIPDDYFFEVVKTCQDCLIKDIHDDDHEEMQETFEFLEHLYWEINKIMYRRNSLDS
jgi:hypothetical protein